MQKNTQDLNTLRELQFSYIIYNNYPIKYKAVTPDIGLPIQDLDLELHRTRKERMYLVIDFELQFCVRFHEAHSLYMLLTKYNRSKVLDVHMTITWQ